MSSSSSSSTTTPSPSDQKAFVVRLLEEDDEATDQLDILMSVVEHTRRLLLDQAPDARVQRNLKRIAAPAAELLNKWCKDEPESLPPWFKQELDTLTQSKSLQDLEQLRSLLSRTQHVREVKEVVACIFLPSAMQDGAWLREESIEDEEQNGTGPLPVEGSVSAFHDQEFLGGLHMAFLETVINVYEPLYLKQIDEDGIKIKNPIPDASAKFVPGAYGRIIHMVQSSGTGKSRLFNELIKLVPGISICLRPVASSSGRHGGYPFGDDSVTTFLTIPRTPAGRQMAASLFIASLLQELATAEVESVDEEQFWTEWSVKKPDKHATSTVKGRRERGKPVAAQRSPAARRRQFFSRIVENADANLKKLAIQTYTGEDAQPTSQLLDWDDKLRRDLSENVPEKREASDKSTLKPTGLEALGDYLCDKYCREPARLLAERISRASPKPEGQGWDQEFLKETFFLAIDEASMLAETPLGVQLTHLRRALLAISSRQKKLRIWTVLMDTYSGITELVDKTYPSARDAYLGNLPPWSRFAWDVFAEPSTSLIPSGTASDTPEFDRPEDLVTLERLCLYGRPLWGRSSKTPARLLSFAAVKLLCGLKFDPDNDDHVVAVWSHRVWLDFIVPNHSYEVVKSEEKQAMQAKANTATYRSHASGGTSTPVTTFDMVNQLVTNGVRTHMRIFQNLQPSGFVNSMTYSEPMLALGAVDALGSVDSVPYKQSLLRLLNAALQKGDLLDRGQVGEFVCRLAMILTRDATAGHDVSGSMDIPHVPLFRTKDFLETLLGVGYGLPPADSCQLEEYVGDSVMSFTHLAVDKRPHRDKKKDHIGDAINDPIDQNVLRGWFSRTQAVQCSQQQPGIDLIIPVYIPSKKSFSYLGISAKLRKSASVPGYKLSCTSNGAGIELTSLKHIFWGPKVKLADGSLERPWTVLMDSGVQANAIDKRVTLRQDFNLAHNASKRAIDALKTFAADLRRRSSKGRPVPAGDLNPADMLSEAIKARLAHQEDGACDCGFAVLHVKGFFDTLSVLEKFAQARQALDHVMKHDTERDLDSIVDKFVYNAIRDVELI